jgi:eukaryotic-like serine/threonine-protein kinase
MNSLNCWEFKACGRETGGPNVAELGICPASTDTRFHGVNDGINAGRMCWCVAGTFCDGQVQGSVAGKKESCLLCDFFKSVEKEEEQDCFHFSRPC